MREKNRKKQWDIVWEVLEGVGAGVLPRGEDYAVRAREGKRGRGLLSLGLKAAGFETAVRCRWVDRRENPRKTRIF